ncbi:MAG: hypothetical protein CME06_09785 [Gemmatimonadetes bacterium]|nr:hypothetical protein [Gemmatimonadota bacterium]
MKLQSRGSHSTAHLARLTDTSVVLVVDVSKSTRTVAAQVLGCRELEPDLQLRGVILNRVGTSRQEKVIREAIAIETGLPVLGAIPRLERELLPSRYLGLVTAFEHPRMTEVLGKLATLAEERIDLSQLLEVARSAPTLARLAPHRSHTSVSKPVNIGVLRDRAFSFYYPENLEAIAGSGAELIEISPLRDSTLPAIDALYAICTRSEPRNGLQAWREPPREAGDERRIGHQRSHRTRGRAGRGGRESHASGSGDPGPCAPQRG